MSILLLKTNKTIKYQGVLKSKNISFSEHIDDIILTSKIKSGQLQRTFKTREAVPMMTMSNSYIRSKIEYCSLILALWKKEDIDKLERIHKNLTYKMKVLYLETDSIEPKKKSRKLYDR